MQDSFREMFGAAPAAIVRAPGRVNLIGEHTDYNDGFVLPLAIERAVWIALRPRTDRQVRVYSVAFGEWGAFDLTRMAHGGPAWLAYVQGVAWSLTQAGHELGGWEGVVAGDVPLGSGLSSSAALELATARAFSQVSQLPWEPRAMAQLAQRAENEWVGVNCGIMDQLISAMGVADAALLIDCRTLTTEAVPLPAGVTVVILDTNTRRGLVDSAYNERRSQCEAAARTLGVPALRDVTPGQFAALADELDPITRARARHVIHENARVLAAAEAMRAGDAAALGRLMHASHASLRDDYEVSSPALDAMVRCAQAHQACHGARMTGAGFGGCAVALVATEEVDAFTTAVGRCYEASTGRQPTLLATRAAAGAMVMP
jgi:galactokinase